MNRARTIHTPDQRLRVFVSSTLGELAPERSAVRRSIEHLRLAPVMFELGARPHPPRELYRAYLRQSDVFVGIYWQRYGWVAPDETVSGLEDEYRLSGDLPKLLYIKEPSPEREPRLRTLLADVKDGDAASYRRFHDVEELAGMVADDLALLLSERFADSGGPDGGAPTPPPAPLTPIIGRDAEVQAAVERVRGGARMLTLTGLGGIGKTRLAQEIARAVADTCPDGVAYVALEAVDDVGQVLPAITDALGVRREGTRDPFAVLADHLRDRRMLLVLDNVEQVSAVGPDLARLLAAAPGVQMLVTSRQPLAVRGEQELVVGPLDLPPPDAGAEAGSRAAAVRMLVDRVRAVRPGFAVTAANIGAVTALCRRLDGLPLAIELVAPRFRLLEPEALLERLADHLDVAAGPTDLPTRQRTLRATIDWSYDLLDAHERRLFTRLGVFAGGASLAAVEAVCADPGGPDPLDTLTALIGRSLITVADAAAGGQPRVRLLETIRAYAWQRLVDEGHVHDLRLRHLEHFHDLTRRAQPSLCGPGQRGWAARLDPDRANLRAAVATAFDAGRPDTALHMAWDTFVYYYIRDDFGESRNWVQRAAQHRDALDEADRARLDVGLAIVGDTGAGVATLRSARAVLQRHDLRFECAVTDHHLGLAYWRDGDGDAAERALETSADEYDALDHNWGVAITETTLGAILSARGRPDEGAGHHERSLRHARRIDNLPLICQAQQGLALLDTLAGRPARAVERLEEAAAIASSEASAASAASCLDALAAVLLTVDDPEAAVLALATADAVRTRLGTPGWTALEQVVAPVADMARARVGPAAFATVWAEGRDQDPFALLDAGLERVRPQVAQRV